MNHDKPNPITSRAADGLSGSISAILQAVKGGGTFFGGCHWIYDRQWRRSFPNLGRSSRTSVEVLS